MKILAIECSASPASVAVIENGKIISYSYINVKLTHSQTLLPMIQSALKNAMLSLDDIDGISVSVGPGSFTGIRIGISAAKGLATPENLPCVPVSTLLGMAYAFLNESVTVCAVMDARCNQLYNALFKIKKGTVIRLCEDRAISIDDLANEITEIHDNIVICGDGADIFYDRVKHLKKTRLSAENLKYQSAVGIGLASYGKFQSGDTVDSKELLPLYLRLPQAERELNSKKQN